MKAAVKALTLLSAAAVCILRFVSFKYEASLSPGTLRGTFLAGAVCAAVCILCAAVWVFLEKKGKNGT